MSWIWFTPTFPLLQTLKLEWQKGNRQTDHTGLSLLASLSQLICHFLLTSLFSVCFYSHTQTERPANCVQLAKQAYFCAICFRMHAAVSCFRKTHTLVLLSLLGLPLTPVSHAHSNTHKLPSGWSYVSSWDTTPSDHDPISTPNPISAWNTRGFDCSYVSLCSGRETEGRTERRG